MTTTDTEYVRTRGGRMVHRSGCSKLKYATRAHEWKWAGGKTAQWLEACLEWNGVGGIAFCRTCCPDGQADQYNGPRGEA